MGLFSSKRSASIQQPSSTSPSAVSELKLGSVHGWADTFLRMIGMDASEIDKLKNAYPTPVPPPNIDLTFDAGEPSNPWTLAVVCAEAAMADALQVYLYAGRNLMSKDQAAAIYAKGGLEGLAGAIRANEKPVNRQWVHEVVNEKIQRSFTNLFERMLNHYLRDFWPQQREFSVRVGQPES